MMGPLVALNVVACCCHCHILSLPQLREGWIKGCIEWERVRVKDRGIRCHALFCVTSWLELTFVRRFVVIFQQIGYFIELLKQQAVLPTELWPFPSLNFHSLPFPLPKVKQVKPQPVPCLIILA